MRSLVIAATVAASVIAAAEQNPPATFRSGVTLVSVDLTVLDKDGRPVSGLTAEDFQIKLNGKVQPIRTVSYVQVAEAPAANAAAHHAPTDVASSGRSMVTNAVPAKDPKIFVLAIDDLSFPPEGGRRTLAAAQRFVDAQPTTVVVGLTTTSGSVVVNPTLDRTAVLNALKHVAGSFIDPRRQSSPESPGVGITEAIEIADHNNSSVQKAVIARECLDGGRNLSTGEGGLYSNAIGMYNSKCATDVQTAARLIATVTQGTTSRQISSLSNALSAMKGAPGLKQMVVLSQGVATTRDFLTLYEPVTKGASAAGVQLSILMEDEDEVDMSVQNRGANGVSQQIGGMAATATRREDRKMFLTALQTLADATGGTFERVITNPDGAFTRAALAGSAIYRLGVEAPAEASQSKPLEVTAVVNRDGLTLHANHSAVLPGAVATESAAERVAGAIKHGTPFYAVPMRVAVAKRRANDNLIELGVGIAVPASVTGPLQVTIGVLDATGALKQGTRIVPVPSGHADYRLTVPVPVAAGKYRVRLAVQDAAGGVGSVETEVDAALTPMGTLNASDLLTWWKDASGKPQFLALDEMPDGIANLIAGLELYKTTGTAFPADMSVKLSIFPAGHTAPIAEVDLAPRADGDVMRAEAALPLGGLAAGRYLIRATVTAAGHRMGDVSALIVKR